MTGRFRPEGLPDNAPAPGRSCGGCTACCDIVPVGEINVRSFSGCPHRRPVFDAKGPGCGIYQGRPHGCQVFACLWLTSPDIADELRPDRTGVVFDQTYDVVRMNGKETVAAQVWVKPGHAEAFKTNPEIGRVVLALLDRPEIGAVLWRTGPREALVIAYDPATGRLGYSATTHAEDPDDPGQTLGTTAERLARAVDLIEQHKGGKRR